MGAFLNNFPQGGKYSTNIASNRAEIIREVKFIDQKLLSISDF